VFDPGCCVFGLRSLFFWILGIRLRGTLFLLLLTCRVFIGIFYFGIFIAFVGDLGDFFFLIFLGELGGMLGFWGLGSVGESGREGI
jgi:hypothetical protein